MTALASGDLETRLNKLSKGKFFGDCYSRGLETFTVGEIKQLCKELANPHFITVLRECAKAHRDFYCDYNKRLTLRWAKPNQSPSEYNIRRICEWLGIPDRSVAQILKELVRNGKVEIQQSGYAGHSLYHRKIVVAKP